MSYSTKSGTDMSLNSGGNVNINANSGQGNIDLNCASLLLNGSGLFSSGVFSGLCNTNGEYPSLSNQFNHYYLPYDSSYNLLIQWGSCIQKNGPTDVLFPIHYSFYPHIYSHIIGIGGTEQCNMVNSIDFNRFILDPQAGSTNLKPAFSWFAIGLVVK